MRIIQINETNGARLTPDIRFISWSSTGDITVLVNGKRYTFNVSAHYHHGLKQMAARRPLEALRKIKAIHDAEGGS